MKRSLAPPIDNISPRQVQVTLGGNEWHKKWEEAPSVEVKDLACGRCQSILATLVVLKPSNNNQMSESWRPFLVALVAILVSHRVPYTKKRPHSNTPQNCQDGQALISQRMGRSPRDRAKIRPITPTHHPTRPRIQTSGPRLPLHVVSGARGLSAWRFLRRPKRIGRDQTLVSDATSGCPWGKRKKGILFFLG